MLCSDFHYPLPGELIAQRPLPERGASRLLQLDGLSGALHDGQFADLESWLVPGDLLVFNDTRVIPARVFGRKASGGRVELLVERLLDSRRLLGHLRASRSPAVGSVLRFDGDVEAVVSGRDGSLFELQLAPEEEDAMAWLERAGHVPLPPYIERSDENADRERYQTVFARTPGAVAAPTAGLHFDTALLERLAARGVDLAWVTLHVGAGTFQPVRVENVEDHRMHRERFDVPQATCDAVAATRARGGRVVAVGTTAVRSLESAAVGGAPQPTCGETELFIRPGYRFRCVDAMVTNFHLPESTLLMLVCTFAGTDAVLAAYRHAVAKHYRFFSYGDAMLVTRHPGSG